MKGFLQEFKAFAIKGNVAELAVAVIVGAAFGKIVSSLVDNMIMPILGIFLGGVDFSGLTFSFGKVVLKYGVFIQSIVDFVIIALVIFLALKVIRRLRTPEPEVVTDTPQPVPADIQLLTEIRDLLKNRG